jgi:tetratricopeptide (TPR) repeat protein
MYTHALNNIDMAVQSGYPNDKMDTLMKRKEKCELLLDEDKDRFMREKIGSEFLKLSYKPNPRLPFIAECLKLTTIKSSYNITTRRDLKVGDVVAIEEPFSKTIDVSNYNEACANCLQDNYYDLVACMWCTRAMYCREECEGEAWQKFHKHECGILHNFTEPFNSDARRKLHYFFEAFSLYNEDIQRVFSTVKETPKNYTIFDFTLRLGTKVEVKKKQFMAFEALKKTYFNRLFGKFFKNDCASNIAKTAHIYKSAQKFMHNMEQHDVQVIYSIIAKLYSPPRVYYRELSSTIKSQFDRKVGEGFYQFSSLIACNTVPNVVALNLNGKIYVIVIRPIKKGEKLLQNLRHKHYFINSDVGIAKNFAESIFAGLQKLERGDFEHALANYKKYCEIIDQIDEKTSWESDFFYKYINLAMKYFAADRYAMKLVEKFSL